MGRTFAAFVSGLIFGIGLTIGQLTNPAKVKNFLDLAGAWDPSLAFVMLAAVAVTFVGFRLLRRRLQPLFGGTFRWPTATAVDRSLVGGAALFGVGWGLVGLCPGPALATLGIQPLRTGAFAAAMVIGMALFRWFRERQRARLGRPPFSRVATSRAARPVKTAA